MDQQRRFQVEIRQSSARTYIALPFDPDEEWGAKDRHCITGTVDECTIRGNVEWIEGRFSLFLGPAWLRDHPLELGQTVEVVLQPEGPLSGFLVPDLNEAFAQEPLAASFFDSLPTFYRNNYMRWVNGAKRPETRKARIAEMIELLKNKKRER